ncbi:hypothetical protein BDY17DRAFT_299466 [Neohortaea acidophila]|uniref:RING-type domain-containing protein n=1 Tax=Neohortaea acidophila TaxID=245834 RepID=A0A6A6PNN8_9PEZI|nr:uncharacterized protein BDY17DRAFT_299466 [Neohortaea acidophila]KAF2481689.1 hypothetical protein BDY17DRAFT_299466 [Neohortaea acidophila]
MDDGGGHGISENELTCAICTEILYQPLTLLDCLHTFCGSCLKEWFKWQATAASQSGRNASNPYTCPSCRESVRRTKADWRLNTLLEGFLKAHPERAKGEQEAGELGEHYRPGENVLPPVHFAAEDEDSEDERLLAETRELSMQHGEPRSRQRTARTSHERRRDQRSARRDHHHLTEARLREHDASHPHIEHQPSLRSLLSASESDRQNVQAEILESIFSEGLLDGIDLDNLTIAQEEELTERIAETYRRRQRDRERSGNRQARPSETRPAQVSPPRQSQPSAHRDTSDAVPEPLHPRPRPPISRPHLFEQTLQEPPRTQRRSRSSNSHRDRNTASSGDGASAPASRSVTDLSQQPSPANAQRERRHRLQPARTITDPSNAGTQAAQNHAVRNTSSTHRDAAGSGAEAPSQSGDSARRVVSTTSEDSVPIIDPRAPSNLAPQPTIRPAISNAAFAPETVENGRHPQVAPSVRCSRCDRAEIQHELHYNCRRCLEGNFNLCLQCYREGKGCNHWFGFGFRAYERWSHISHSEGRPTSLDPPHVLAARKYVKPSAETREAAPPAEPALEEGAFCESCQAFTDDCYWYCNICLEGAWGFCDKCVKRGQHCTHPLAAVAHINTLQGGHCDPSRLAFVGMPHLRQDTYVNLPFTTSCDVCHRSIPPASARFHCYQCNDGDYDICNECYWGLVSQDTVSQANGPSGWRKCPKGHRMVVVGFEETSNGAHLRTIVRDLVGGWRWKEDGGSQPPSNRVPPDGGAGLKCLALYNYFPKKGVADELAFPKNAEIREVEDKNGDWYVGTYAGRVKLFPSNHVRIL